MNEPMDRNRRRKFGQNFLINDVVIRAVAGDLPGQPGDRVLEVGPGHGAITEYLLKRGFRVTAVEIDTQCVSHLRRKKSEGRLPGPLRIERADFLEWDVDSYLDEEEAHPWVAGNLPYNRATPILIKLLPRLPRLQGILAMVQLEVGQRMGAEPGGREFGFLSTIVQSQAHVRIVRKITPGNFRPIPNVMSAMVLLTPRADATPFTPQFRAFASLCFGQKRKVLYNSLEKGYPRETVRAALAQLNLDERVRAEALTAHQIYQMYEILGLPEGFAIHDENLGGIRDTSEDGEGNETGEAGPDSAEELQ